MTEQLTIEDFAKSIKEKYPQYAAIPDAELTGKILAKYPQYRSQIIPAGRQAASKSEFEQNLPAYTKPENALPGGIHAEATGPWTAPLDFGIGVEKALGLDPMHPILSSPKAALDMFDSMRKLLGLAGPAEQGLAAYGMVNAPIEALKRGGTAIREQNLPEAAQAVGELYTMAKPAVEGAAKAIEHGPNVLRDMAGREELMTRAMKLQDKSAQVPYATFGTPFRRTINLLGTGKRFWDKTRAPRAAFYESQAVKGIPPGTGASAAIDEAALSRENYQRQPLAGKGGGGVVPIPREPIATRSHPDFAAADEASRIRQASSLETVEPNIEPYTPPPPRKIPSFIESDRQAYLDKLRTMRGSPGEPDWKAIHEAIDPRGTKKITATQTYNVEGQPTKFGKDLVAAVPEITTATKETAPSILKKGLDGVIENMNAVEDAIPEGTTVEKTPIVSQLVEIANDYIDRGLTKYGEAVQKIADDWLELPDRIPWGEFKGRKRGFKDQYGLKTAAMRRAYGVLMGASGRASQALSEINNAYHTVRVAMDAGDIPPTGIRARKGGEARSIGELREAAKPSKTVEPPPPPAGKPTAATASPNAEVLSPGDAAELNPRWTVNRDLGSVESDAPQYFLDGDDPENANAAIGKKGDYYFVEFKDSGSSGPFRTLQEAAQSAEKRVPQVGVNQQPMLGATPSEAMTKAAAGRRPELLKEGKQFDQTRLVESPLFQGRGGPQGFLGTDVRAEVSPQTKVGSALPNPSIEASAASEMETFASDVREMQGYREGVSGGGATTMESNAVGKEIEENLSAERSRVGRPLGVKPPKGLEDMTPGRIATAIEKGKGTDYARVKRAFTDAAKGGFSDYRESQRETGRGLSPEQQARQVGIEGLRSRLANLKSSSAPPLLDTITELEQGTPGMPVTMRSLREKFGSQEALEAAIKDAVDKGEIYLTPHDHGWALSPEQRADAALVQIGDKLYVAASRRQ